MLEQLQPSRVFAYFEQLCAIPHGSGNTAAISAFCADFAKAHGLSCDVDNLHNVVIRKPASAGYEGHPTVVLQGHLDMVCEKEPDRRVDFLTDPVRPRIDGDWVTADGTTLGGDDGIAVAMVLAILEADDIPHPPLEAVFTVDEETGMYGAEGLDPAWISGRLLLNIDSEDEGVLTVGCAGGARADLILPITYDANALSCYRVTVEGLLGGHSGTEAGKNRLNAAIVMGRFLASLGDSVRLVELSAGSKDNAIPAHAEAVIATAQADVETAAEAFAAANATPADPHLRIAVSASIPRRTAVSRASSANAIALLTAVPNGVQSMSPVLPELVQTSLNLGVLRLDGNALSASFSVRSSNAAEKQALLDRLEQTVRALGGDFSTRGHYPAWEYRETSPLRDTMVAVYERLAGRKPTVNVIHAGLECGLFGDKLPGLDAVSFGPDILEAHTPRERLSVSSTARTYRYLLEVLKSL